MLCISRFLAFVLLTSLVVDVFLVNHVTAWRRRRRRCNKSKPKGVRWVNNWDGKAHFECDPGKSISRIKSHHLNCVEDRLWYYQCQPNIAAKHCYWTVPANSYDATLSIRCPHNGFISGVSSWHSNSHEDRRFKFKCCHDLKYLTTDCRYSIETSYDKPFDYTVYYGYYLVGVYSTHNNKYEDRRWKFLSCRRMKRG